MKRTVFVLASSLFWAASLSAQSTVPLLAEKELRSLVNEISGERAQEYVRHITHFQRLQPSRGYHDAAEWVAEQARRFGLSQVEIAKYPTDNGTRYYYMSRTEPAWDAQFAELWIVEPKEEKLTGFDEIPMSLAIMSRSCDVTGELVYVGEGTSAADYEKTDVKGKIVLASGSVGSVASMAVDRYGAAGVVVINQRFADDEPDNVSSIRIRTKVPSFGFGLSHRRGEQLRRRLIGGEKLIARAVVKTDVHDWPLENVVAVIPGSDPTAGEILLTAHLCHLKPGANDNASGSAVLLEVGRTLKRLMDEGKISAPRRTIRFLWVPEMAGSIAFAATQPEIVSRTVAGLNLDMVGQYLNKNNSTFFLHLTPHSRHHYVNDVMINLVELLAAGNVQSLNDNDGFPFSILSLTGSRDAFRHRIAPYVGGSDQVIFNDGLIGVPMPFFLIWPDRFYHTSGDQAEVTDPTQLKRTAWLAAAAVVFLADDAPEKARLLASEAFGRCQVRIAFEVKRAVEYLDRADTPALNQAYKEALNFVDQAYRRESAMLSGIRSYSSRDAAVDGYIDELVAALQARRDASRADVTRFFHFACRSRGVTPKEISVTPDEKAAMQIVPRRDPALKGPFDRRFLADRLAGKNADMDIALFKADGRAVYEVFNFMDGRNSLLDIRNAVSAEFEPIPLKWIEEFAALLELGGLVKLEKRS
jgi:aminopeptidase YwaD